MTTNKSNSGCNNTPKKCCSKPKSNPKQKVAPKSEVKSNALKRVGNKLKNKKPSLWQRFLAYLNSPAN